MSAAGDPLERLARVIDFEVFRGDLGRALSRSDRDNGGRLEDRLTHFGKPRLLIVDELGYRPFEANAAHLFFSSFRGATRRLHADHQQSLDRQWGSVFSDAVVATAILDRLLHHSHVVTIRGDSYRLQRRPPRIVVLDTDSARARFMASRKTAPTTGISAYYHLLFVFNLLGDVERCVLLPGDVHSADCWRAVLESWSPRYRGIVQRLYFRAEGAFANPEMSEFLETQCIGYAMRRFRVDMKTYD